MGVHVVPDRGRVGLVLGVVVHIPDQDASQEGGQCAEQEDRAEKEGEGHRGQNIWLEEQERLKATEIHSASGKASEVWRRSKESNKKKKEFSSGVRTGMSGREMFMFDPKMVAHEDDDDEGGEAFDLSKMDREGEDDMAGVKVHEIKFDEYGIMDDGVDDSTADKLKAAGVSEGAVGGVTGPIDEDLFEDEDLDELEEDLTNLEV